MVDHDPEPEGRLTSGPLVPIQWIFAAHGYRPPPHAFLSKGRMSSHTLELVLREEEAERNAYGRTVYSDHTAPFQG